MNAYVDAATDVWAITAIVVLAYIGGADPATLGAVAGLGGYSMRQRRRVVNDD